MKSSQHAAGAAGAAATHLLTKMQDECDNLLATAKDYRDPAVDIPNPREEAATIMEILKSKLMDSWAKIVADQTKIVAWLFNHLLLMRRYEFNFILYYIK